MYLLIFFNIGCNFPVSAVPQIDPTKSLKKVQKPDFFGKLNGTWWGPSGRPLKHKNCQIGVFMNSLTKLIGWKDNCKHLHTDAGEHIEPQASDPVKGLQHSVGPQHISEPSQTAR